MKRWYGLIAFAIALAMLGVMACDDEDEDEDEDETPVPLPTAPPAVVQPPAVAAPTAAPVAAVAPVPTVAPAPAALMEKPGGTLRWFMNATIPNLDSVRSNRLHHLGKHQPDIRPPLRLEPEKGDQTSVGGHLDNRL